CGSRPRPLRSPRPGRRARRHRSSSAATKGRRRIRTRSRCGTGTGRRRAAWSAASLLHEDGRYSLVLRFTGEYAAAVSDEIHRYNKDRWEALVEKDALFTRPMLDLDAAKAEEYLGLERLGLPRDLKGRKVLCLAGGGGQQSAAFALLGSRVTVLDLSAGQLSRDRAAADHYGVE